MNEILLSILLVDECSMIPAFMTPILLTRAGDQISFIGDYRQLAPVAHNRDSSWCEMERWMYGGGQVHMLNVSVLCATAYV